MERYKLYLYNDADLDDIDIDIFESLEAVIKRMLSILEDMKEDPYCYYNYGSWHYTLYDRQHDSKTDGTLRSLLNV